MTNSERLALFAHGTRERPSCSSFSQHIVPVVRPYYSVSDIWLSAVFTSVFSLLSPPPIQSQVSFRYHCQLYSEWRRTNQKVRLLMPDMKGAHTTQRSVPTKSTKKMTDETIV